MAFVLTDGGNQIILDARTGAPAGNVVFGQPCMFKVADARWQDYATGTADSMIFTDSKGRTFALKGASDFVPISIGRLEWVEGPLTLTAMTSGLAYFVMGAK
jgi:hypothetical protein